MMDGELKLFAVRGAIQIDRNSADSIRTGVLDLIGELEIRNRIDVDSYVSIFFSQTSDLTALNPATALRSRGYDDVPLFCTQEPDYQDAMPRMIRTLMTWYGSPELKRVPVYLNGAERLRADLFKE